MNLSWYGFGSTLSRGLGSLLGDDMSWLEEVEQHRRALEIRGYISGVLIVTVSSTSTTFKMEAEYVFRPFMADCTRKYIITVNALLGADNIHIHDRRWVLNRSVFANQTFVRR